MILNKIFSYCIFLITFLGTGCHPDNKNGINSERVASAPEGAEKLVSQVMNAPVQQDSEVADQNVPPTDQKIIRRANIRFQVSDFKQSTTVINQLLPHYQAQLISANEAREEGTLKSNLEIKVPPTQFEPLLNKLLAQSIYLNTKSITAEDVTTEYIDVAARLKTKQAVEARYRDLLKQARTVEDIIAVEEQLRHIREEIESSEARLTYINRQSSFSTIHLEYYQTLAATALPETSFAVRIRNALRAGWDLLLALFIGLLHLWPLFLALPVLIFCFRKFIHRYPPVH